MPPSLRLFIAAYPPESTVSLLQSRAAALPLPDHKPVAVDQVHITLVFLSDRRPATLPQIETSIAASCKGVRPCIVRPRRLVTLPEKGPARLVAAETDAPPPLLELQKRLANRLAARDKRSTAFLPHLTLLRFPGAGADFHTATDLATPDHDPSTLAFEVRTICLMKSTLHPLGVRHELLREFALG